MALQQILGEVTQGRGAGLQLYAVDTNYTSKISVVDYLYNHIAEIDSISFAKKEGFFQKYVEKECISINEVIEVKKLSEVGNDMYFQLTYVNGEISAVKSWKNLKVSDKYIVHPASAIIELFITKFVG